MLSALAKYIFGGVMGDAPETTSMQYETREINDWLLVDMPDQDIDNEDMDSESDDDDFLTAVPLLLAEEVSKSPRPSMLQRPIVIGCEIDSTCDKSYRKIRKGFHDKIHPTSSKIQVHAGDKIQGNFVEAISLETDDISNDKPQHNLSEVQESKISKQSKSKNSKPKKCKKNKINKKCIAKIQDTSISIKKKLNEGTQEKFNDNILLNLKKEILQISNEIPEKLDTESQCKISSIVAESNNAAKSNSSRKIISNVEKDFAKTDNLSHTSVGRDSHTLILDNSSHKNVDKVKKDSEIIIMHNSRHRNANKIKDNFHTDITNNSNHSKTNKAEDNSNAGVSDNSNYRTPERVEDDSCTVVTDNSSHRNETVSNILESCASKIEEKIVNEVPKSSYKNIQPDFSAVENNLRNKSKRSYADVVKAQFDTSDPDYNKEVSIDENESDFPDLSDFFTIHEKTQDNQQELADNRKPKSKKSKMQSEADIKSENISICVSNPDEFQETTNDNQDLSDKTIIVANNLNEKCVSDRDAEKSNIRIPEKFHIRTFAEVVKCHTVLEDNDESKTKLSEAQQNSEIIQSSFEEKNETVLIDVSEKTLQDMPDARKIKDTSVQNLKCNNIDFQNDVIQDFIDDTYFGLSSNSDNENIAKFIDSCQDLPNDYLDKAKDNLEFQQNLDDGVLENIADLWDIYTKIQDNSDDEMNEISDDEMNENLNESFQEISDREMNETSDEQITDDEMNDNSLEEYEEISNDDMHRRSFGNILRNLFDGEDTKLYSRVFEYNPSDESEESDNESFISRFILPSITSSMERKPELLQPFKCNFLDELKQNASEIPNHHSSCVPLTEYELVEYFNFEPQYFYACQSLQYPSSYALAIAEYYANSDHYCPQYSERCNAFIQKYKKTAENQTPPARNELRLTNTAEILEKIMNPKCSVLPTKTAVVLEHVKDLKPIQQAIQYEARKYLTRSQLNRQNRNYIYQSSSKTNRRRNLQRNHSGVNNNRKCC